MAERTKGEHNIDIHFGVDGRTKDTLPMICEHYGARQLTERERRQQYPTRIALDKLAQAEVNTHAIDGARMKLFGTGPIL